jgi:hypothetical protein
MRSSVPYNTLIGNTQEHHNRIKLNGTHYFVFNGKQKCYILLYITRLWVVRRRTVSWVSKPFLTMGHARYCEPVCRPHVGKQR